MNFQHDKSEPLKIEKKNESRRIPKPQLTFTNNPLAR